MDCSPTGTSAHGNSSLKNTGMGCHALLQGGLPNPGTEPRSPILRVDSLLTKPPGKPKNPGVGSLSLLQGIVLTQELMYTWITYETKLRLKYSQKIPHIIN